MVAYRPITYVPSPLLFLIDRRPSSSVFASATPIRELALQRLRAGDGLVLPVILGRVSHSLDPFPSEPHLATGAVIRDTISEVFKLNGVKVAIDSENAIAASDVLRVLDEARTMLASKDTRLERRRGEAARALASTLWSRVEPLVRARDVIGKGASAIVYKGVLDGRPVAVKTLLPTATKSAAKQFDNEASLMLSLGLNHPHVLSCLLSLKRPETGEHYLVLPLCGEGSLANPSAKAKALLSDGRVLIRLILGAAEGMSYIHALKVRSYTYT